MITLAPPIVVQDVSDVGDRTFSHASSHPAFTRSTPPGSWSSFPIELVPTSDPLALDLAAELDVAARSWRAVSCASVQMRVAPTRIVTSGDDGVLAVVWETVKWPSELIVGVPAQTVLHVDANGHFRDADVHLNAVDFVWSNGAPGAIDLRGVLTHELGHVLGLGHSSDPTAAMFASTGDAAEWRSLERDDANGLCFLYPGTGSPACGVEHVPCPAPFMCVAARCERPRDPRSICAPCTLSDATTCKAQGDDARCVRTPTVHGLALRCGRPCVTDSECGAHFRCEATTEAGDRQCVGGCAEGPHACANDADCKAPAWCRDGSCAVVIPALSDAGIASSSDAATDASRAPALVPGGSCASSPRRDRDREGPLAPLVIALAFVWRRIRRKRTAPSAALRASCRARR